MVMDLRFGEDGLLPVVVQEAGTREVLLLGYANSDALRAMFNTGRLHLWSRSRRRLWLKGERSGNYQLVREVRVNCEGNSLLVLVDSQGPACHDGYSTCFYRRLDAGREAEIVEERRLDPAAVYGSPEGGAE